MRAAWVLALALALVLPTLPAPADADTPAVLTLVAPAYAAAGGAARLTGSLTIAGAPVIHATLEVFADGARAGQVITTAFGTYTFDLPTPGPPRTVVVETTWLRDTAGEERSGPQSVRLALPPGPPTALAAATEGGRLPVSLTWAAPTSDGGAPLTSYQIERRSGTGGWGSIASAPGSALSHLDASAPPGSSLTYRLRAVNAAGSGPPSGEAAVITGPAAPATISAALDVPSSGARVGWTPPASGSHPVTGYRVWRDGALLADLPASAREHVDPALARLGRFSYEVSATNAAGDGARAGPLVVRTPPGEVPGFVATTYPVNRAVHLSWSAADPDAPTPVTSYLIERQQASGGWATLGVRDANVTTFVDQSVGWSTTYTYAVTARNAAGSGPRTLAIATVDDPPYVFQVGTPGAYVCPAPPGSSPQGGPPDCGFMDRGFVWQASPGDQTVGALTEIYVNGPDGLHVRNFTFDAWSTTYVYGPCSRNGSACTSPTHVTRFDRNMTLTTPNTGGGQILLTPGFDTFPLPRGECNDVLFVLRLMHPRASPNPTVDQALLRLCQ